MGKKSAKLVAAETKAIDPILGALFSSSAGPVTRPTVSRYASNAATKAASRTTAAAKDNDDDVEMGSDDDDDDESSGDAVDSDAEDSAESVATPPSDDEDSKRSRKRKRKADGEDLEARYLDKLLRDDFDDDSKKTVSKKLKTSAGDVKSKLADEKKSEDEEEVSEQEDGSGADDKDDDNDDEEEGEDDEDDDDDDDEELPIHESLVNKPKESELDKAARTVFLANVSSEAISSKPAKKTLLAHLSSVLDTTATPPQKIESIRFRSMAFSTGSMPKRAAYITGALMNATTKSSNAYVVYPTAASARKAAAELNGTVVLDRHLRVDSVAHPSQTDHRRCVFVGNLGFVDDETVINTDHATGETKEKKRHKVPSDVEEGLWRFFGQEGRKVENVRVVRDPKTRVGKGFAYVQFYSGNDVESALHLDGKKFAPMLPRPIRVTRAKDPRKTNLAMERSQKGRNTGAGAAGSAADTGKGGPKSTKYAPKMTPEQQSMLGRTSKLFGRSAALKQRHSSGPGTGSNAVAPAAAAAATFRGGAAAAAAAVDTAAFKKPEQFVHEGKRATARDAPPSRAKAGSKKGKGRAVLAKKRGARRAEQWRKDGK